MIVQGVDRVVGADAEAVLAAIAAHQARPVGALLSLERDGAALRIRLAPVVSPIAGPSVVYLVRFLPQETVEIGGGENAGHTIDYTNIVTDWDAVARWDGLGEAEFGVEFGGDENAAVVVQRERFGPVLTAAHDATEPDGFLRHFGIGRLFSQRWCSQRYWPGWARTRAARLSLNAWVISAEVVCGIGASITTATCRPSGSRTP